MAAKLVREVMHIGVTTCRSNTPLVEVVRILLSQGLESCIVLDENSHAVGMLSRREAVAAYGRLGGNPEDLGRLTAGDVMRPDIPQVPPDIPAMAAVQIMLDQGVREIYLLHHAGGLSWPAAVLRFDDVLRCMAAESEAEIADLGAGAPRKSPIEAFRERYSKAR